MAMRRWVSTLAFLSLLGGLSVPLDTPVSAAAPPPCALEAADADAAALMARRCGGRVEVLSKRTETVQEFMRADGTGVVEIAAHPQRARKRDGSWSKLDATLQANADGSLSPVATPVALSFSGGGSGALVSGDGFSLSWPGVLPRPVVSGTVATYPEVLPGVDLVMTALETGFSEVLVVKTREAARNPALRAIRFGTTGVRWESGLQAVDSSGKVVLAAQAPLMWDSATPFKVGPVEDWSLVDGPERSSVERPGKAARTGAIGVSVAGGALTLTPSPSLLDDPKLEFPVFIDPTLNHAAWTMINSQFPNQSYWSIDRTDCPGGYPSGTNCAKVGRAVGLSMIYRSLFQFDTSSLAGRQVLPGTVFAIDLLHSAACGPYNWTWLMRINVPIDSGTTWNNNAGHWPGGATAYHQSEACQSQRRYSEFAGNILQGELQQIADNGWTWATWGLRAESESDSNDWKKYDAGTARMVVPVNLKPNMPTQLTVDNKACVSGANRPVIKTVTPTLKAHVTDNDGDTMDVHFAYARWTYRDTPMRGEFTGDGKDDVAFWRPSDGNWHIRPSNGGPDQVRQWGDVNDIPVTGDFNADNKTDVLVWRPATGDWHLYPTGGSGAFFKQWGESGDVPLAGDFNGDNKDDAIVWRPHTATWWINLTDGSWLSFVWGEPGDIPLTADINGDNRDDTLIWRPTTGDWWVRYTDGSAANFRKHGALGDVPLVGDFNNDGRDDLVYYRPSNHTYSVAYTGGGVDAPRANRGDKQVAADYNGDGKADLMSWSGENGSWSSAQTGGGTSVVATGYGNTAASYVHAGHGYQGWVPHNTFGQITTMPLADGSIYTFRSQTNDAPSRGASHGVSPVTHMPGNCEFHIDVTKPAVPTVNADIYKEGTDVCSGGPCGSVGKTGRFTFSSSGDVTQFRYWWNGEAERTLTPPSLGGTVNLDWTPTSGGAKVLNVKAIDRAGNEETKVYQFVVKAESPAIGRWKMNDPNGSTTVLDDSGNGRTMTVSGATLGQPGRVLGGPTVARFDGVNDFLSRADFLNTSKTYSVAMWARLDAKGSLNQSLVSQKGNIHPAFNLVWDRIFDRWAVQVPASDVSVPTWKGVVSTSVPQIGVWTHLAWVYDSASLELRLYVNGALEDVETGVVSMEVTNAMRVGDDGQPFAGAVADLWVWDRAVFPKEIVDLAAAVNVGKYRFDFGYDPSVDESGYFHDLDYYGGATIDPTSFLKLDGIDDNMASVDQVIHTDQSFTVSARVRLTSTTGHRIFLSQNSQGSMAGFFLYYQSDNGGQWAFGMRDSMTAPHGTTAAAPAVSPTSWHQVTGVFDAQKRQIQLYVDGVLKSTVPMNATWQPWRAEGPLQIGRALNGGPNVYTGYFAGDVDDVYVYQGIGPIGGPLGQWKLNDAAGSSTAADSSGNQQTGTVFGPTLGAAGRYGTAAQFDGTNDYVGAPSVLDTSKSFTVAAWVKADGFATVDREILGQFGTRELAFHLQHDFESGRWRFVMPNADGGSTRWWIADSTSVPQLGVWTHLAATYDAPAGEIRLYVNGSLQATTTGVVGWKATGELRIGRAVHHWHGAIDEVNVWNRVISPSEILALQ